MIDWTERPAEATFDLHGQAVSEAVANAERFLRAQDRKGTVEPADIELAVEGLHRFDLSEGHEF